MITFSFNTWNHSAMWGLAPTLPAQITAAAAAGFDFVGLDVPSLLSHERRGLTPSRVRDLLDEVAISCFELVPLVIGTPETEQSLADVARLAPLVGARQVLAVIRAEIDTEVLATLRRCVRRLDQLGIGTSIEFLPCSPVDSIVAAQRVLDAIDEPGLALVVDSWHFFAGPDTWSDLAAVAPRRLGFVQFCDTAPASTADPVEEYRHHRQVPGRGLDDLDRFARTVTTSHPDVTVSVEVLSRYWRARAPAELIRACAATTRPFWRDIDVS